MHQPWWQRKRNVMSLGKLVPEFVDELVLANHILARHGIVDGFGHVSVRHPFQDDCFLISRSMAPALVAADDIVVVDLDGVARGDDRPLFLERFIHAELYRARPDLGAIVHSHSPSVIPFGVVANVPLRPIYHMSAFLHDGVPLFEIRDTAGEQSDMLIRDATLGKALATALGEAKAVLMRGHGSTVVGSTLRLAVFRAIYLEINARLQANAMQLGPVTFLNAAEAMNASRANEGQVDRAWQLWQHEVDK
jgi:ribulose-5-phosphate 4-epimerase/fuculose-1-phosphate aldolase